MLNKAVLMGRLTADPELRRTQNNTAVTSFALAVERAFAHGKERQTDFLDVVAWGKTAEFAARWFRKGMLVAVSGRLQSRNWEDKQGQKRKSVVIIAEELHFAEPKRKDASGADDGADDFREMDEYDDGELPF